MKGTAKGTNDACVPVYFWQDGYVVCTMAYGQGPVSYVPGEENLGLLMNVINLTPRAGQIGLLFWTEETRISVCAEQEPTDGPYLSSYDTTLCKDFCSLSWAQNNCQVGEHVSLVVQVLLAEQKYTNTTGDSYLEVSGSDIENGVVTSLRLWRYAEGDLSEDKTYIIRGLKVVIKKQWDDEQCNYILRRDGTKTLDCTSRTTVEDVSHIESITAFFQQDARVVEW